MDQKNNAPSDLNSQPAAYGRSEVVSSAKTGSGKEAVPNGRHPFVAYEVFALLGLPKPESSDDSGKAVLKHLEDLDARTLIFLNKVDERQDIVFSVWTHMARLLFERFSLQKLDALGIRKYWLDRQAWHNWRSKKTASHDEDFLLAERQLARQYFKYLMHRAHVENRCPLSAIAGTSEVTAAAAEFALGIELLKKTTVHDILAADAYELYCDARRRQATNEALVHYFDALNALRNWVGQTQERRAITCACPTLLATIHLPQAVAFDDLWTSTDGLDSSVAFQHACITLAAQTTRSRQPVSRR